VGPSVEELPGFVRRLDASGACDFCNQAWLRFTGVALEQQLGSGWTRSLHEGDRERCLTAVRESALTRTAFELSFRLRRFDGSYAQIVERGAPLASGGFLFCGVAAQGRERFADLVAHELRTPVQAMQSFLVAAESSHPQLVQQLSVQLERLTRVVASLAEADGGPSRLALTRIDLAELARAVVDELAARRPDREILFESGSGELSVQGHRERLSRALHDLLDNALKFSPGREPVAVAAFRDGRRCGVRVSDRGIGIPLAEMEQLGQRWFRGSNADPRMYPGLGLGLATAREAMQLHRGALRFESELTRGTAVTLELPAA
jgi:signal transduction histidine kinase